MKTYATLVKKGIYSMMISTQIRAMIFYLITTVPLLGAAFAHDTDTLEPEIKTLIE